MKAFALQVRIPVRDESPIRNFGSLAKNQQEAIENVIYHYRNYPEVQIGTITSMPLRPAVIQRNDLKTGEVEYLEVDGAIGQGWLFYITKDGEKFHRKCKLVPSANDPNHFVCKIWGDNHEIRFEDQD